MVDVVETGKEAVDLFQKLDTFADLTLAMKMTDIDSVQRWVKGAKSLYNAAEPFVSWAKSKAIGTAFAGSDAAAVAAQASVVIAYLAAEFYVALQILDAGVANEKAYFERYKKIMRVIENGGVPPRPDPPPPMPPAWESEDYKAWKAHQQEDRELREAVQNTIRAEKRAEQAKKDAAIAAEREKHKKEIEAATQARNAALKTFDETEFPKRYAKAYHLAFRDKIVAEMKKTKFSGNSPAGKWYDCLTQTQGYGIQEDEMDDQNRRVPRPRQAQPLARRGEGRDQQVQARRAEVPRVRRRPGGRVEGLREEERRLGDAAVTVAGDERHAARALRRRGAGPREGARGAVPCPSRRRDRGPASAPSARCATRSAPARRAT
jgi:hypothetical protein